MEELMEGKSKIESIPIKDDSIRRVIRNWLST